MYRRSPYVAAAVAVLLGGCGGGSLNSGASGNGPVALATAADALRELGNTLNAARLAQTALPGACSSGADNIAGPLSKPRSFVYFTGFTGTVVYENHNYAACVDNGVTYDGLLEAGATSDGAYTYAVRGSQTAVLLLRSNGTGSGGVPVSIGQSEVGTIETHVISSSQTEIRSGLESKTEQTPQSGGSPSYTGTLSIGVPPAGPTFDVLTDSSGNGGNGSETIAGGYSYTSTVCSGGDVTVTTPGTLLLTPSADGSYHYASGGTLSLSSGTGSVTYTFSASGATLSGSVSGSLSSSEVQQAFSAGSGC